MNKKTLLSVLFAVLLVMGLASSGHGAVSEFIKKEFVNGIGMMTGGVGIEEREQMKAQADPYSLKLEFAVTSGSYLANIDLAVERADGSELLRVEGVGPWVYLALDPGKYRIKAWYKDELKSRTVEVAAGKKTVILYW